MSSARSSSTEDEEVEEIIEEVSGDEYGSGDEVEIIEEIEEVTDSEEEDD